MARIEGRNPVIEALKGQRKINKIYLKKGNKGQKVDLIKKEAKKMGIPLIESAKDKIDEISNSSAHQGVVALVEEIKLFTPEDILQLAKRREEVPFVVILDQIQDPHNFGSMIRTAYAAGAHGIIFPKDRAADITSVVAKTSAGAIEHIMMAKVTNINQTIKELKEEGLWIAGADMEGADIYYKSNLKGPIGVVIGNEGAGIRRLVRENCDFLIKIPMVGKLGSLNASVASGIIIYEIIRQREVG